MSDDDDLPSGVLVRELVAHGDERGTLWEVYRDGWTDRAPAQWNVSRSAANVLRGVHLHLRHHDYLTFLQGRAVIGLHDLRRSSPTYGSSALVAMDGDQPAALSIPPGVAHGFCHVTATLHCYGMSETWTTADELGCRWDDPGLRIEWPLLSPIISARDAALPPLRDLAAVVDI